MHGPCCPRNPQEASDGREPGRRPQSLIKCLVVSCGASVWDRDTGTLIHRLHPLLAGRQRSQMDTFDLPVTTARAILDTAEQEARDPIKAPKPSVTWTCGPELICPCAATPARTSWEELAGPAPLALIMLPLNVCAPPVTRACHLAPPQPAALSALSTSSWPSGSFPGLPDLRPPIFAAPHLGTLQIPSVVAVAVVCARVYICICDALGSVVCFLALF